MIALDDLEQRVAAALDVPSNMAQLLLREPLLLADTLEMTLVAERLRASGKYEHRVHLVNPSVGRRRTAPLMPQEHDAHVAFAMVAFDLPRSVRLQIVGPDPRGRWGVYMQRLANPPVRTRSGETGFSSRSRDGWYYCEVADMDCPGEKVYGDYIAYNPLYAMISAWRIQQRWSLNERRAGPAFLVADRDGDDDDDGRFDF